MRPIKLKPCPFCRCADPFIERGGVCVYYVFCNDCAARGPPVEEGRFEDNERAGHLAAAREWNKRKRKVAA